MDQQIVFLKGPERIRRRPAVVFGSDDAAGVMTAIEMLLDVLAEEAPKGYCSQIAITQHEDGAICLQDRGRGIYFGTDDSIWQELFCNLFFCSAYKAPPRRKIFEKPSGDAVEDSNLELYAVLCASEYMDIRVNRDGFQYDLHFEKGENIGGLKKSPSAETAGTKFCFKPDKEVFSAICVPARQLADHAQALAFRIPGLRVIFRQEISGSFEQTEYHYPKGVADFLQEQNRQSVPVCTVALEASGRERYNRPEYTAKVRLGLCFQPNQGFIKCYHNEKLLSHGGNHLDAILDEICRCLQNFIDCSVKLEALLPHLQLVVLTEAERNLWVNGARTGIHSVLIRDMAQDMIYENFPSFLKKNRDSLLPLFAPQS